MGCPWFLGWKSVCCCFLCKWPCLSVRVLRNASSLVRGLGSCWFYWTVLYEGVKDGIREYCLRVIEIVFSKLSVDMEFLYIGLY